MRYAPILIAISVAAIARADGERTLHLAVHGSVDSIVVGAAISKELGLRVTISDGTCDLPCLDITVDGRNAATVWFAPRTGSPRQRTITLPSDTKQWPLVLTLLVGNVVRDEAQDVLAELPSRELPVPESSDTVGEVPPAPEAPPEEPAGAPADSGPPEQEQEEPPESRGAPAPPTAVAPPAPPGPHRLLGLGLVPGLSTDLTQIGSVRHFLSVNLLVGVSGGSSGLSLSGIADIQRGLAAGFQVSGIAALARQVAGTQVAGIAAVAGDVDGVQVAGTAAVADRIDGFQLAGIAAVSRSKADNQVGGIAAVARDSAGIQLGGIAAVAGEDGRIQVGGIAAAAGKDANFQVGGITSVARGTANIQVAGVVNVASRLRGIQLAPINVARDVDGIQLGVINVGGSADGFSFGLINIVPGGRYDLEAAVDSSRMGTVLFRHGGRRWHNVYGVGGHPVDETGPSDDIWMYGLGFGPSLAFDNTVIDLEAIGWQVNHGPSHETDVSILGQLRLSVAHHWGPFAIVAGGILNAYITNDQGSPLFIERRTGDIPMDRSTVTVTTWPSAFIGLRI